MEFVIVLEAVVGQQILTSLILIFVLLDREKVARPTRLNSPGNKLN